MWILGGLLITAVLTLLFWVGMKYGAKTSQALLALERAGSAKARADRDDAKAMINRIKVAALAAEIDVKKVFPFLALILAIALRRIYT